MNSLDLEQNNPHQKPASM